MGSTGSGKSVGIGKSIKSGSSLIHQSEERQQLAALNLSAGRQAKQSTAMLQQRTILIGDRVIWLRSVVRDYP